MCKNFLQPDWQIDNGFFKRVNHGVYANPGIQEGVQDKDVTAVSQTDLNAGAPLPSLERF